MKFLLHKDDYGVGNITPLITWKGD